MMRKRRVRFMRWNYGRTGKINFILCINSCLPCLDRARR